MHTKDFTGNKSSYRKSIEDIDKCLPDLGTASTFAFIIKAIHWSCSRISIRRRNSEQKYMQKHTSGHIGAFMVASQDEEVFRKFEFVT